MSPENVKLLKLASLLPCIGIFGFLLIVAFEMFTWVTDGQLDRLSNGMTRAQVIEVLGNPLYEDHGALLYYAWGKRTDPIIVIFDRDGRMTDIR